MRRGRDERARESRWTGNVDFLSVRPLSDDFSRLPRDDDLVRCEDDAPSLIAPNALTVTGEPKRRVPVVELGWRTITASVAVARTPPAGYASRVASLP